MTKNRTRCGGPNSLRRPEDQIEARTNEHASADIDPEHELHRLQEPVPTVWDSVFARVEDNDGNALWKGKRAVRLARLLNFALPTYETN